MIDLFAQGSSYACMTPALNRNFVSTFCDSKKRKQLQNRLPTGLRVRDLNPLDPASRLYFSGAFLYSAAFGVQDKGETIVTQRDRTKSLLIGDSGGFSLISGGLSHSIASFRAPSLKFQEEYCDVAMILDVPTEVLNRPDSIYRSFDSIWTATEGSIRFALNERRRSRVKLATVLQGDHLARLGNGLSACCRIFWRSKRSLLQEVKRRTSF
ncbi:hypothetical protein ACU4GR_00980 [Methylobacterium oryzae CBMB20]